MVVYFNGQFIEMETLQLMTSLVAIAQAQVALAQSFGHEPNPTTTAVPASAVGLYPAHDQGILLPPPSQTQPAIKVEP